MSIASAAFSHADAFRWRQGDPSVRAPEARLEDLAALRDAVEHLIGNTTADARADGMTWPRIASVLGMTHRAAQRRYGGGRR